MSFRFDLPDIEDAYALADWIEVMMLLSKKPQISRVELLQALAANIGITPQELETPINLLFAEIGRRRRIVNGGYPLMIESSLIKLDMESSAEFYQFLLLISLDGPMRRRKKYKEIEEIFDKVVCAAMRVYLGDGSEALRFGWPPSDGRPTEFKKALVWLSTKTDIPIGSGVPPHNIKDGGVDVVAWRPFMDHRTAFIVIFTQCTVQYNWYPKGKDVIESVWRTRIDAADSAVTALAIPFMIHKNFEKWDDLRHTVGIVFDRLRLAQMLGSCSSELFREMVQWSVKEISRFSLVV